MRTMPTLLAVSAILVSSLSFSQVAIIDYMKVAPNNVSKYLDLEKSWKLVHQERAKVGLIQGWYLYRVRHTGTSSPYQYVTLSYYKDLDSSENLFYEGVFENALKGVDLDSFYINTENIRDLTKSEVFLRVDGLSYDFNNPAKFILTNFIAVEQGAEENYEDIERYIWKPMHQELQKKDKMANWSLWSLFFYTHNQYKYFTMNEFYEYSDIDSYSYSEVFSMVHEGKDLSNELKKTVNSRTSAKTELWELVDYVAPNK